jgi:thiamine kinase-like enzyme
LSDAGLLVPTPVGIEGDEELVTFLEGVPVWAPGTRQYIGDTDLRALAALLRQYHDVADEIGVPEDATWNRLPSEARGPHSMVCHNDFAPWNVLRCERGLAIIDWDLAAPGTASWDLAYACWVCIPLWNDEDVAARRVGPVGDRATRLRRFVDAYGADDEQRGSLLDTIELRQLAALDQVREWARQGRPGWDQQWSLPEPWRHGGGYRRELKFLESQRSQWHAAIAS